MKATRYLPFVWRGLRHAGPPLHLTLFVTGRCNLRCRHCFHWKEVADDVAGPTLVKIQKLADSAARMGPLVWVSLGGGEPFLRGDLPEVATAFGRHGLRHLAIPTNGLVKSQGETIERILKDNPDTFLSVSVSFDGPPDVHDSIRQIPGGHAKSMESVVQLRKLAETNDRLGVGVIVTVTAENQDVLADHTEELVRELRPDNLTINLARGTALDVGLLEVDHARYMEVVDRKRAMVKRGDLPYFDFPLAGLAAARDDMMYDHISRVAQADGADLGADYLPCTAGKLSAVIFENGEVHPCEMLGKSMGNLNDVDWDLSNLWGSAPAEDLRMEIRRTRCTCTWECAQADNVLFRPRNWPQLAARALKR